MTLAARRNDAGVLQSSQPLAEHLLGVEGLLKSVLT